MCRAVYDGDDLFYSCKHKHFNFLSHYNYSAQMSGNARGSSTKVSALRVYSLANNF